METKANYVLIGLFTLGGLLGALGLLLWFAKVEVDRQYAYFDILFEDVSGLGSASDVRYNGLPVGQVVDLGLDDADSSQVRVRIEVSADTPVNTETVAKLQSQGVTGVSFVGLSGGSEASTRLPSGSEIPSERTALQSVFEGAPLLLDRAVMLLENVNEVFDAQNRDTVTATLDNLASASARLDTVLNDFESLSGELGAAAREIAGFTDRLDSLAGTAETTLTTATGALETATGALETASGTVATIGEFTTTKLVPLAEQLSAATQTANRVIDDVGTRAAEIAGQIDTLTRQGAVVLDGATQTLDTANQTFASANTAIDGISTFTATNLVPLSDDLRTATQTVNRVVTETGTEVQRIAGRIDDLADRGGAALDTATVALDDAQMTIRDARTTVARANTYIDNDLTPLTNDLRTTTQTANRVIDDVGTRAAVVADSFVTFADDGTALIATANTTFMNADLTLEAVYAAMDSAILTLDAANRTFASANQIIENDIGGIVADLRGASTAFTTTINAASDSIDTITEQVVAASTSAANFAGTLEAVVTNNQRQLSDFVRLGLPSLLTFTQEARSLVVNIDRLVNKIERDPARFLLGTQNSRFNR
jgi:phospholipid/cholesterol/gamma-HCH transport system substrate-binding protein